MGKKYTGGNIMTPLKAIRAKCMECSNGQPNEVKFCPIPDCALYKYRSGKSGRKISPEHRAKLLQNLKGGKK